MFDSQIWSRVELSPASTHPCELLPLVTSQHFPTSPQDLNFHQTVLIVQVDFYRPQRRDSFSACSCFPSGLGGHQHRTLFVSPLPVQVCKLRSPTWDCNLLYCSCTVVLDKHENCAHMYSTYDCIACTVLYMYCIVRP